VKATIQTLWGQVTVVSNKIPGDGDIEAISDKKEKLKLQLKFFPMSFNDLDIVEFTPRKPKYDNQDSYGHLCRYLQIEGMFEGEGNFPSKIRIPLGVGPVLTHG
jgi:hypothetical protein